MSVDAQIAEVWPERWAKANDSRPGSSKRRNKLRKSWTLHCAFLIFQEKYPEARCGTCQHFEPMPLDVRHHCAAESDYYGYVITVAENVCTKWKLKS